MNAAIRTLSLSLALWFTASASFAPCCWSMTMTGHQHEAQPHAGSSSVEMPAHHHHDGTQAVPTTAASEISAAEAHPCAIELVQIIPTTRPSLSLAGLLARTASNDILTTQAPAILSGRTDSVQPGGSPGGAFLNPLRI
jgi:hypothetical protein